MAGEQTSGEHEVTPSEGLPRKMRKIAIWLDLDQISRLEQEVWRRRSTGENIIDGQKIQMTRGVLIREAVDKIYPPS